MLAERDNDHLFLDRQNPDCKAVSIFVSVAAYRDPELAPTLRDCVQRARYPDDLRFGVCWQHSEDEAAPDAFADRRVWVIDVPWHASRGACWARAEIMKLWDGQDFFLQLDLHHRFVQDWDAILFSQLERCGAAMPVLSSYCFWYDPHSATLGAGAPMRIRFHEFSPDGIPMLRSSHMPDPRDPKPANARFVSAHFLFTLGRFVADVPYDPELYFYGEEITLAVRAFTHGYSLFHPSEHVMWHEYSRPERPKHWGDHIHSRGVEVEWHTRDALSRRKTRALLVNPHFGEFGCGRARSVADYEAYAGLNFRDMSAEQATLRDDPPPDRAQRYARATEPRTWRARIVLARRALPAAALEAPLLWYVGFHAADKPEIYREDATGEELRRLIEGNAPEIVIERRFRSARRPATWTVWPMDRNGAWLEQASGAVMYGFQSHEDSLY